MKPLVIVRNARISWAILVAVLASQLLLSIPAATCRGFPPINPFWEWSPFFGLAAPFMFSLFDDRKALRTLWRFCFAIGMSLTLAWAQNNLGSAVPHYNSPIAVIFTAPFVLLGVLPVVFAVEWVGNKVWQSLRDFAEVGTARHRRNQFSLLGLLAITSMICLCLAGYQMWATFPASAREVSATTRFNLMRISDALRSYYDANGFLPFDERGSDEALFALHELIDARCFDAAPRKAAEARWDLKNKRLERGDFDYLNVRDPQFPRNCILVCGRDSVSKNFAYVASIDGDYTTIRTSNAHPGSFLGCYLADKEQIVATSDVFNDWQKTHQFACYSTESTSVWNSENANSTTSTSVGVTYHYSFSNDRLTTCRISTRYGEITERIATDKLDRIVGIEREPADWQAIIGQVTGKPVK